MVEGDGDGMRSDGFVAIAVAVAATMERARGGGSKASRRWVQNTIQIFTLQRDSSNDTHLYRLQVGYCWVTGGGQSREGQQVKLAEFEYSHFWCL